MDRLLHRLALQVRPVAEASFDLDQRALGASDADLAERRHVFVAGLARAGTTILMRRFYATGAFCSLTYRHMPFVLAPGLWGRLAASFQRQAAEHERAHGDGIRVDLDSPESLDEVFWRVMDGEGYIADTHLAPHAPDAETAGRYRDYVAAILSAGGWPDGRYLSKNNNNLLRLATIRELFPRALLLVPFRDPLTHAASLLRQHRRFLETQRQDAFVRAYMGWLGHHEFGGDHRPFRFAPADAGELERLDSGQIDYWLALWRQTYGWLEKHAPRDVVFVCYEDLCTEPRTLSALLHLADVPNHPGESDPFQLSSTRLDPDADGVADAALSAQTARLYQRLVQRSRDRLSDSSF